jgi:hypothetical protein
MMTMNKPAPKYELRDIHVDDKLWTSIYVLDGEFKDLSYYYGTVAIPTDEELELDNIPLTFSYTILGMPFKVENEDLRVRMDNVVGDILVNIMENEYASRNRDNDTGQSGKQ